MKYIIKFCPQCGGETLSFNGKNQYHCPDCLFTFYRNVAAAAAVIIYCRGKILFTVRAKEPGAGMLDLPGGFIDSQESAEDGVIREVREELGLTLSGVEYFCNQANKYHYRGVTYDTLDFYFIAQIDSLPEIADRSEVSDISLIALSELDFSRLAFTSTAGALRRLSESAQGKAYSA